MEDYGLNMEEVLRVVDSADVLIVRFAILDKRLLVDTRTSEGEEEAPFIGLVPKAKSVEDRFRKLKQIRPCLPLPEKIMSFMWPRQTTTFQQSGVWERIVERLVEIGGPDIAINCAQVLEELKKAERAETIMAIQGHESYQSLWERPDTENGV